MVETCTSQTGRGKPCSAQTWRDGMCRWHHPDLETERAAWRERGGQNRSNAARASKRLPRELKDVQLALCRALAALEAGDLEPQRATAMAALGRAIVTVTEAGTLEERLAALEARTERQDGRGA